MRKNLFLIVMLCLSIISCKKDKDENPSTPGTTQLSILATDFANAGDVILMSSDSTDLGSFSVLSGQNITWDYTALTEERVDTVKFLDPNQTPGAQYFASISNMAMQPEPGQPLYFYLNKTTEKIEGIGLWANFQGTEVHANFSDKPIPIKFPMTYNMSFNDSSYLETVINVGPGQYGKMEMRQYFEVQYDGSGTIKLPNNKTYQCLREKRKEITKNDFYMGFTQTGPWTLIDSQIDTGYFYNYYAKNKKWNVASVSVDNFTNNTIQEISFLKE